jgi:hypothetical protein
MFLWQTSTKPFSTAKFSKGYDRLLDERVPGSCEWEARLLLENLKPLGTIGTARRLSVTVMAASPPIPPAAAIDQALAFRRGFFYVAPSRPGAIYQSRRLRLPRFSVSMVSHAAGHGSVRCVGLRLAGPGAAGRGSPVAKQDREKSDDR